MAEMMPQSAIIKNLITSAYINKKIWGRDELSDASLFKVSVYIMCYRFYEPCDLDL